MEKTYTVTVYAASPGTPLALSEEKGATSAAGHMYYKVSDGRTDASFGFAPIEHGVSQGPGRVITDDVDNYQKPRYARTMEISKEQYDKLTEFGQDPAKHGFNMQYGGLKNSCIDFTWGALNHAGLHRQVRSQVDKIFEGDLKPLDNVDDIKSIKAPLPDSKLNGEKTNPMPERTLKQRVLTELEGGSDPRNPAHPDHRLNSNIDKAVALAEAGISKPRDQNTDALTARLHEAALLKGFGPDDRLVVGFNERTGTRQPGEIAFLQRTGPNASPDPYENRVQVPTGELRQSTADETYRRVALQVAENKTPEVAQQQQELVEQSRAAHRIG